MLYKKFEALFPTELSAIQYFIKIRYPDGIICPHCGAETKVYHSSGYPRFFNCKKCFNSFSVFSGTIMERTHSDIRNWFFDMNQMVSDKKGISAMQQQRHIG
ncbi:MAG: transposase [Methanocalculaceae archaeon]|jgi:transposase-like protein|nr:transposase [Methanocalculaceae archaeon]